MDYIFDIIMMNSSLFDKLDWDGGIYKSLDVVLTSRQDQKAVIKNASVIDIKKFDLSIIGGLFVMADIKPTLEKPHSRFKSLGD